MYAGITIKPSGADDTDVVSYSGSAFIVIRSKKHDSSPVNTDFQNLEISFTTRQFEMSIVDLRNRLTKDLQI